MSVKKAASPKKKTTKKSQSAVTSTKSKKLKDWLKTRIRDFLARRPHRSFRMTRRRDYIRSLKLPGYFSFTFEVMRLLWKWKKIFIGVVIIYALLSLLFVGLSSQDTYSQLSGTLNETSGSSGLDEIAKAGILLAASVGSGFNAGSNLEAQQIVITVLILLITWLCTVWLLRVILAGQRPKLRDGLYNSGAPIIPTVMVSIVITLQLLPVSIAAVVMSVASASGLLDAGVVSMIFWMFVILLGVLSLYWMTSTILALIIVTLPGMYPMNALRTASDLVIGRRIRILLRILWVLIVTAVVWVVIMIPFIIFDAWVKKVLPAIADWPIVPIALLVMGSLTIVWLASYMYVLYRKVVDDDAAPA